MATAPHPAPCRTAALHVWVTRKAAALGTFGGYVAFTNRGAATCTLRGWPTLTAAKPGAASTGIRVRQTMFGPRTRVVRTIVLRHGQTAVAAFTTADFGPGRTGACPPPFRQLRVVPPDNRDAVVIRLTIPACSRMMVSMVVPASELPRRG